MPKFGFIAHARESDLKAQLMRLKPLNGGTLPVFRHIPPDEMEIPALLATLDKILAEFRAEGVKVVWLEANLARGTKKDTTPFSKEFFQQYPEFTFVLFSQTPNVGDEFLSLPNVYRRRWNRNATEFAEILADMATL